LENTNKLTYQILIAMIAGIVIGTLLNQFPKTSWLHVYFTSGLFDLIGKVFINILKMLVVPIVFVSLVCGTFSLDDSRRFGKLAAKTIVLYLLTTAIAISLALGIAALLGIGSSENLTTISNYDATQVPSLKDTLLNIVPSNPVAALAEGNMLQIIVFAILFGIAISWSGKRGEHIKSLFRDLDVVILNLMNMVLKVAPYGVFCLVTTIFALVGFDLIYKLAGYFAVVLLVLAIHLLFTYSLMLQTLGRLSPLQFFKHMLPAMLFAFSTSSSSASIPVVLNTVENKLGVKESVASFVIPLGATINMDGTAIMQGVATVFIANSYNIAIGFTGFLKVILIATLASIGTAGVPGVGLITLTMVLLQVGIPIDGISLIYGVDRILDMSRTAVNVAGDSMVASVVAKSEKAINLNTFYEGKHV